MFLLDATSGLISTAIESGDIYYLIVTILGVAVIPAILNYLAERKRSSKFNSILNKQDKLLSEQIDINKDIAQILNRQDVIITEQKDANKHILSFIEGKTSTEDLTSVQISNIFGEFLQSSKHRIINETKSTIRLNNLKNKQAVISRVKSFSNDTVIKIIDKMSWIKYKGKEAGTFINNEWGDIISDKVIDFIYDNDYVFEEKNKVTFYDFDILDRNLELMFQKFVNNYYKKLHCLKSDLEKKINSYDK